MKPIAIIGMASIFPRAENLTRYWENILNELNCIEEIPASRWNVADYYDADPNKADKTYSKYGGFIPDIIFDPLEFGLPPNILEVTDVSQLLSLIVARDALENAGYGAANPDILNQTGVILGMVGMSSKVIQPLLSRLQYPVWEKVLRASRVPEENIPAIIEKMKLAYISWNENAFPGAIGNVVAGRIANRLDLGGMNCTVDAACGSSLAAVSMSINELEMGHADMMITGGVDTDNSVLTYLCFSKTPAFSKGDQLCAFSADADGMLVGEGIGMLVLKRLGDAERDGDRIYAIIRGVGTSSDGHYKSIYAPRASGQAKALQRAYQDAGYPPSSVGLIEAHGTGTNAGDPAEFEGLRIVFGEQNPKKQYIALGSVKSQIGHTKAAAGAASLIKAVLALYYQVLPATINVSNPHPDFDVENSPFYINSETRPWFRSPQESPRRAGVSSFGFGGTNFHITLEEVQDRRQIAHRIHHVPHTVLLFAETSALLKKKCQETLDALLGGDADLVFNQLDEETYQSVMPQAHARVGFVAQSVEEARDKLGDCLKMLAEKPNEPVWSHPKGIFFRSTGIDVSGKTVALFSGQGSQYLNMGRELAIHNPTFRMAFERADTVALAYGREKLTQVVFPIPVFSEDERKKQQEKLTLTENAQPAIGTMSMALFELLRQAGLKADFCAGHSFGELTALWAAGVLDDEAFLRLALARGEAMSRSAAVNQDTGCMMAVKGNIEKVKSLLEGEKDVSIANFNSPSQVVVAGASAALQAIKLRLEEARLSVVPLKVSAAFHTTFVQHAQAPFKQAIQKEVFRNPNSVVYSNVNALPYDSDSQKISQMLAEHILSPVRFHEEIEHIYRNGGSIFIEFGPKNILTNLVNDILKDRPHEAVALNPNPKVSSDTQFHQAVLQLRVLGFELGDTDPFRCLEGEPKPQPSKVSVVLNGGLYITEKTRSDFENALREELPSRQISMQDGMTENNLSGEQAHVVQTEPVAQNKIYGSAVVDRTEFIPKEEQSTMHKKLLSLIEQLQKHQQDLMQLHQQFLQNDQISRQIIQEIVQAELSAISKLDGNLGSAGADQLLASIAKSAEVVSSQHSGSSQAHQEYIKSQIEFSQMYALLMRELIQARGDIPEAECSSLNPPAQAMADYVPKKSIVSAAQAPEKEKTRRAAPPPNAVELLGGDDKDLATAFLQIVSDKTGYPVEMLELGMDMEADLGIDSIKRVEILSAMQEKFPHLPSIEAEELTTLRTLEQIIVAFNQRPEKSLIKSNEEEPPGQKVDIPVAPATHQLVGQEIKDALLSVVSDKTGYPVDMLDLGMDMEADLGIDSIKRVEILSAIQEQFPQLPTIEAEELATLHTLEEILAKFTQPLAGKSSATPQNQVDGNEKIDQQGAIKVSVYPVKVKRLPDPDWLEFDIPDDCMILITDDGVGKSRLLVDTLLSEGKTVGLMRIGKQKAAHIEAAKETFHLFEIGLADEDEIQRNLEEITALHKKIAAFIHVHPPAKKSKKSLLQVPEEEEALLKTIFLIARHLKKPLAASAESCRPAFMTLSCMDGHFGLSEYDALSPIAGGLTGLTKSLRLEWPAVFCRALDFHPQLDEQFIVEKVLAELHDPDLNLSEVGYTPEGRFTLSLDDSR